MAKMDYDVSGVPSEPPSASLRRERRSSRKAAPTGKRKNRPKVKLSKPPEPGSFAARVTSRQVNLLKLIAEGLPPLEFLPASDGMLVRGKRHLVAAPQKTGKSLGMLVHSVDMVLAGARVVIFDRENGSDIYARRLADIIEARTLSTKARAALRSGLGYHEFPELRPDDAEEMVAYLAGADLVVFDAQRMFLSDFGLRESVSDDYAAFMSYAIDPLFRAGVASVILDNTGLGDSTRGRGTTAKGDLNEVLFSMETLTEFDQYRRGRLSLKVERSRFGNVGEWTTEIGGGAFDPWRPADRGRERPEFRDYVLGVLGSGGPLGMDPLIDGARKRGIQIGTTSARTLLRRYVEDASVPLIKVKGGYEFAEDT